MRFVSSGRHLCVEGPNHCVVVFCIPDEVISRLATESNEEVETGTMTPMFIVTEGTCTGERFHQVYLNLHCEPNYVPTDFSFPIGFLQDCQGAQKIGLQILTGEYCCSTLPVPRLQEVGSIVRMPMYLCINMLFLANSTQPTCRKS